MKAIVIGIAGALATVGAAEAATVAQLDVNGLTAVASDPGFGANYTGTLTLSDDANSGLFQVLKDGISQGSFGGPYTGTNFAFSATFAFVNGNITGVGYTVSVASAMDGMFDDVYSATIVAGVGNIAADPGKPGSYIVAAATNSGSFSDSIFGGVDVSEFMGSDLVGHFLSFKIDGLLIDGDTLTDDDVDIEIFIRQGVIIPLPTPVGLAGAGLLGLAAIRRRRS